MTQTVWTWKDAPDLMARLSAIQNHPVHYNQDIMTFTGFFGSRDELELHVVRAEIEAERYDQDREMDAMFRARSRNKRKVLKAVDEICAALKATGA